MTNQFCFTFVSNSEVIANIVREQAAVRGVNLNICLASMEEALPISRRALATGTDVILGSGGTGKLLRQHLENPVVTISRGHLDILEVLIKAKEIADYIGITSYSDIPDGLELFSRMLGIKIRPIVFTSTQELTEGITFAIKDGVQCIVGGGVCVKIAGGLGCKGMVITPSPRVIQRALDEALIIANSQYRDRYQAAWLSSALDSLHEGLIGVDTSNTVLFKNTKANELLEIINTDDETITTQFLECIGMRDVLLGGTTVTSDIYEFESKNFITSIRPIIVNEEMQGALASFHPVSDLRKIEKKVRSFDKERGFIAKYIFDDIAGESHLIKRLKKRASRFSSTGANIFIQGETGTGKELLAHSIHMAGPRRDEPFVPINCASLPDSLLESELYGYEDGAFTGARKGGKEGLFLLAHQGTIFLDEVGDISPLMQIRLLRVLESQEIFQVGGSKVIPISVHVISSSWKDLNNEVREGRFRADLLYRLNMLSLNIPPLRERLGDIPLLCKSIFASLGISENLISERGNELLCEYSWPGNVRELKALLWRYSILLEGAEPDNMLLGELLGELQVASKKGKHTKVRTNVQKENNIPLKHLVSAYEVEVIEHVLKKNKNNKKATALELGISENTLWRKLRYKSFGIDFWVL